MCAQLVEKCAQSLGFFYDFFGHNNHPLKFDPYASHELYFSRPTFQMHLEYFSPKKDMQYSVGACLDLNIQDLL